MSTNIDARSLFANKEIGRSFRSQNTIAQSVHLTGFGFWTGKDVSIQLRPAPPNSGIVFVRSDIFGHPRIPALVCNREEKPRQTSLAVRGARVDMIEHVLAALYGLHIDNCEIWTDQPEMPGFDGSSQVFVEALDEAGIVAQPARRAVRIVTRACHIGSKNSYMIVTTNRQGNCEFQYTLIPEANYPIQTQRCQLEVTPENFREELAKTRTFIAKHEADTLLTQGLCQRVTPQHLLVLTDEGPLENRFLYENECARHKTLDMVGDFALLGFDLIGTFESFRGGHSLNAECVRQLLEKTLLLDPESVEQTCCFRDAA
ncbi:MAG: UDP-3-O-acyl-N-acetylglucosamine deacetylase [Planctomycetaceae bacterium]|nr:UDP-3-O-acyl-N-acetylglucosamine deacetylase [Planctomycetaceae bacterium]